MEKLRLQFSLRSMLMAMTAIAFITAEAVVFPNWVAGLAGVLGTLAAAAFATMMVLHGRASERTLAIGALFPLGWMLLANQQTSFGYFYGLHAGFISHWNQIGTQNRHAYVTGWLYAIQLGSACVFLRWTLERGRSEPAERLDPPRFDD